jgi:hypothetical protein
MRSVLEPQFTPPVANECLPSAAQSFQLCQLLLDTGNSLTVSCFSIFLLYDVLSYQESVWATYICKLPKKPPIQPLSLGVLCEAIVRVYVRQVRTCLC